MFFCPPFLWKNTVMPSLFNEIFWNIILLPFSLFYFVGNAAETTGSSGLIAELRLKLRMLGSETSPNVLRAVIVRQMFLWCACDLNSKQDQTTTPLDPRNSAFLLWKQVVVIFLTSWFQDVQVCGASIKLELLDMWILLGEDFVALPYVRCSNNWRVKSFLQKQKYFRSEHQTPKKWMLHQWRCTHLLVRNIKGFKTKTHVSRLHSLPQGSQRSVSLHCAATTHSKD